MTYYVMSSAPVHAMQSASPGIAVTLPEDKTILSLHTVNLNIPGIPSAASQCHILPELASGSVLSIFHLCDHDLYAHYHKKIKVS